MVNIRYTTEHEWIRLEQSSGEIIDAGIVGITDYAQQQLGDIVFVELPTLGAVLSQGDEAAVIESVKAASELYSPVGGEVVAVNENLTEQPALVNTDPAGSGWFVKIRLSDTNELNGLMDEVSYRAFVDDLD